MLPANAPVEPRFFGLLNKTRSREYIGVFVTDGIPRSGGPASPYALPQHQGTAIKASLVHIFPSPICFLRPGNYQHAQHTFRSSQVLKKLPKLTEDQRQVWTAQLAALVADPQARTGAEAVLVFNQPEHAAQLPMLAPAQLAERLLQYVRFSTHTHTTILERGGNPAAWPDANSEMFLWGKPPQA